MQNTQTLETLSPNSTHVLGTSNVHHLSEALGAYRVCLEWRINFKVPRVIKIKCQPQLPIPPTGPRTSKYTRTNFCPS